MISNHEKPRWFFYPIWIILTSLCIPIAFFFNLVILRIVSILVGNVIYVNGVRYVTEEYLWIYPFIPIAGLLTGVSQYGLLRRYLPRMCWWVLATTGGWLLGVLLVVLAGRLNWPGGSMNPELLFILMGLAIGTGQWLLLRRRLPQASWWIGASVVGWFFFSLIIADNTVDQFRLFAFALFPACVTAATLAWLMKQIKPTQLNSK